MRQKLGFLKKLTAVKLDDGSIVTIVAHALGRTTVENENGKKQCLPANTIVEVVDEVASERQ